MTSAGRYRDALGVPEFRAIFAAHVVSMAGSVMANFALTVLVYARTGSPLLSAVVFTIVLAPHIIGGAFLSALCDRVPARRLLVVCNLTSAGLASIMALPRFPVPALLALALALGMVQPIFLGTRAATLPDVLTGPSYVPGRSLLRLVSQGAQMVGFAASGLLLTVLTPNAILLLNAGSFLAAALILRIGTMERPPRGAASQTSLLRDSVQGLSTVMRVRRLRRVLILGWTVPALAVVPEALAVPYSAQHHAGTFSAGLLMSAIPLGTVLGEVSATWLVPPRWQTRLVGVAATGIFVPMLVFATKPPVTIAIALLFLSGLGAWFHLGQDRRLLDAAPPALAPRALSIQTAGLMFWQGLGFSVAGAAAEFISPGIAIAIAAGVGIVAVALLAGETAGEPHEGQEQPQEEQPQEEQMNSETSVRRGQA